MTTQPPQRVALVTGASRGLGWAIATAFAKSGIHVLLLARTQGALEELYDNITAHGGSASGVPMDLTDYDAIDRLGAHIFERWGRLDILIGNAGTLGILTPVAHITPDDIATTINVNFIANFRLIRAMEPLLMQADAPRAVFTTSGIAASAAGASGTARTTGGRKARPFWGNYASSKAALNALVLAWAAEHVNDKLRVNLIAPGAVRTTMRAQAMPGENPESLPNPDDIAPLFVKLTQAEHFGTGEIIHYEHPSSS